MVGGVFHEHGHRAVATLIGLVSMILAIWCGRVEGRSWVRRLAWGLFGLVCLQGLLGGLTVILLLPPWLSASHGTLAQSILCIAAWLAYACSLEWGDADAGRLNAAECHSEHQDRATAKAFNAGVVALVAVFIQLLLGAWMRHTEAGLAVPFFPLSKGGELFPEFIDERVMIHMAHRGFAIVVLFAVWRLSVVASSARAALHRHSSSLALVVFVQALLGAMVVWMGRSPAVTSLHVTNGALVLLLTWWLVLRLWRRTKSLASTAPELA
jgi:cytochrome c oxidase assembly protein subunit 15